MTTIAGRAVSGALTATGTIGPYQPIAKSPFNIFITGTFVGAIALERSLDGTTYTAVTSPDLSAQAIFTAPATFTVTEPDAAVLYRLNCTAYTSGTINGSIG